MTRDDLALALWALLLGLAGAFLLAGWFLP